MENIRTRALRSIPYFAGKVRADFRDLYRVLASQTASEEDLAFIERGILARRERLKVREPKARDGR